MTVRIGVVGCGAIAQVQHLPNLLELDEEFEVVAVCDLSADLAAYAAKRFKVPNHLTSLEALLNADIDAVMLCHTSGNQETVVAAFAAGKHVLVEKPVASSLQEIDRMIAAQEMAGKVGQAAYMKIYDPAFLMAKQEIDAMDDYHFVQINHLHPHNELHLAQFRLRYFDDVPASAAEERRRESQARMEEAFGDLADEAQRYSISFGLIHDLYSLRGMLGVPSAVISTEIWHGDRAINTLLEFPNGARCALSRVDMGDLWDFRETLEVYGENRRVLLSYCTGFSRRVLSELVIQGIDENGVSYRNKPAIPWESAFTAELKHFHECIANGTECRSSLADVRHDVSLSIDIAKVGITGESIRDRLSVAASR